MIKLDNFNKYFHKKIGNLYLSKAEIDILKINDIDYEKYNNIKLLIYEIEEVLESNYSEELEWVLNELSEFDYYNNVNK